MRLDFSGNVYQKEPLCHATKSQESKGSLDCPWLCKCNWYTYTETCFDRKFAKLHCFKNVNMEAHPVIYESQ